MIEQDNLKDYNLQKNIFATIYYFLCNYKYEGERKYSHSLLMTSYIMDAIFNGSKSYHKSGGSKSAGYKNILPSKTIIKIRKDLLEEEVILEDVFLKELLGFDNGSYTLRSLNPHFDKVVVEYSFMKKEGVVRYYRKGIQSGKDVIYDFGLKKPKDDPFVHDLNLDFICKEFGLNSEKFNSMRATWSGRELIFETFEGPKHEALLWKVSYSKGLLHYGRREKEINIHDTNELHIMSRFFFKMDYDRCEIVNNDNELYISFLSKNKEIQKNIVKSDKIICHYFINGLQEFSRKIDAKNNILNNPIIDASNLNKHFEPLKNSFSSIFSELIRAIIREKNSTDIPYVDSLQNLLLKFIKDTI